MQARQVKVTVVHQHTKSIAVEPRTKLSVHDAAYVKTADQAMGNGVVGYWEHQSLFNAGMCHPACLWGKAGREGRTGVQGTMRVLRYWFCLDLSQMCSTLMRGSTLHEWGTDSRTEQTF